jgi:nucleotide-binding universal stress UspA family protein
VFENVVVGATDSAGATRAVRHAIEVARASGGTLHIVTALGRKWARHPVVPDGLGSSGTGSGPTERLMTELRQMAALESVRVETHPVASKPAEAITRVAAEEGADLIVVGSRTDHGTRHLSSVPKAVMDRAACAVLVV